MTRQDDLSGEWSEASRMRTFVLPLAVLVVVVALVSGLVLAGVVQGHEPRVGPEQAPTTQATVEIAP